MPWRGPELPGEFPTLGYQVMDFIEENCSIPDGDHAGEPYLLTDEMQRFLLWFYRLDEDGKFFYNRGGQLVRSQKWGKGPFSAAIICAEATGPVVFDGWDSKGEPVGRPWATPWIQVTAVSEDQTDNVYRALMPMIQLGPLANLIPDTGETRINLPGGGRIEPVTSSARSRLGQRVTFSVQDETHSWNRLNGGRKLADTQRRNLAGMKGRWLETTNAWDPAEESVAQQTAESQAPGVYRDDSDGGAGSIRNKRERRKVLRKVYGDSWWVDLDRIDAEIEDLLLRDPAQAERFFLNRKIASEDAAFDIHRWNELTEVRGVPPQSLITLGVDGARYDDALAIIATEVETGLQFPIGIWEKPQGADENYEHDFDDVDARMVETFDTYDVARVYIDPQRIETLVNRWQGRWGDKKVFEWFTNRPRPMAMALRAYREAMSAGELSHNGDEVFARHIGNAKRRKLMIYDDDRRPMWTIGKDAPMSPRKIDAAMAGCLSWEARGDAIAAGIEPKRENEAVFF